jgi:hypothetical protein
MSMGDIRAAFAASARGQLQLSAAGMRYAGEHQVLSVAGFYADRTPFAFVSAPFLGDPVARAGEIASDLVRIHSGSSAVPLRELISQREAAARKPASRTSSPPGDDPIMSKLANFADRAPGIIAALEARADTTDARHTALQVRGTSVFDRWDAHADAQAKAIATAEDAINRLSNGAPPLDDSSPAGAGAGTQPKV